MVVPGTGVWVLLAARVAVAEAVTPGGRVRVAVAVALDRGVRVAVGVGLGGVPRVGVSVGVGVVVGSGPMAVSRAAMVGAADSAPLAGVLAASTAFAASRSATSSSMRPAAW